MAQPIHHHSKNPSWLKLASTLILLSIILALPSYWLVEENFTLIKGDFEATAPGSASFSLILEKAESLLLRVKFRAGDSASAIPALSVNAKPLQGIRIIKAGEATAIIPASFLHAGENSLTCAFTETDAFAFVEKVLFRNVYGINPHIPVIYVVFDESVHHIIDAGTVMANALRAANIFFSILLYCLLVLLLCAFLFYENFGDLFRGLKCFLIPALFPWLALFYSVATPYHVLYPRQTLFWVLLVSVFGAHLCIFRRADIGARLHLFRKFARTAGVPDICFSVARRLGLAAVVLLLFLAFYQLPSYVPVIDDHDKGSQAAYEYWTTQGFSYGKDIIQNVGPLGFINYPDVYSGFLKFPKQAINITLTGLFVFALWQGSKTFPPSLRLGFILCAGVFVTHHDVKIYLLLLLAAHFLVFANSLWIVLPTILLLSLLALAKGTCFFIALFMIASSVAGNIVARRFSMALWTFAGFSVSLITVWVCTGQSPGNFLAFVRATASFTSGYNGALSVFEPTSTLVFGLIVFAGGALSILRLAWNGLRTTPSDRPEMIRQLLMSAIASFIFFVTWKHGFVRADESHVLIFFQYALVSTLWILFKTNPGPCAYHNFQTMPWLAKSLAMTVIVACLAGLHFNPETTIKQRYAKINTTWNAVINAPDYFGKLEDDLKNSIIAMQVPKTRALVGKETISYFGIFPALMLYNEMNYISTPSTISFASWNEWIMEADAQFFRDDLRAPAYLLADLKTTDRKLVAQDDSLAQLEILHRYAAVDTEAGNILLRRTQGKDALSRKTISERNYGLGEWVNIPQDQPAPIWVRVRVGEGLMAGMTAFAYKPPQYWIEILFKNGITKTYQFIPRMAATGFLISPLIVGNDDLLRTMRWPESPMGEADAVAKFKITCNTKRLEALCGQTVNISFDEVQGLAL